MSLSTLTGLKSMAYTGKLILVAMACALIIHAIGCNTAPDIQHALTGNSVGQFTRPNPARTYNADTLFEYIDGEAEIYLNRGFEKLYVFRYKKGNDGREYIVDAYDLGTPENARGIHENFKTRHSRPVTGAGPSATTDGLTVNMNYGPYFIRILAAEDVGNPSVDELTALAQGISKVLNPK